MLRIRAEALSHRDGKYIYKNNPFTGVCLSTKHGILLEATKILVGIDSGHHASPMTGDCSGSVLAIDITGFTDEDLIGCPVNVDQVKNGISFDWKGVELRMFFDGEPYSGLAYDFIDEICLRELFYENGFVVNDARWDMEGKLIDLFSRGGFDQIYSWDSLGFLESAEIVVKEHTLQRGVVVKLQVLLGFTAGALSALKLFGGADNLDKLIDLSSRFPVKSSADIADCRAARRFNFFGDGQHGSMFAKMVRQGAFSATTELGLPSSFLAEKDALQLLSSMTSLKRLQFFSMGEGLPDSVKQLKRQMPFTRIYADCHNVDNPDVHYQVEICLG